MKTALVTGASCGIGEAIARKLTTQKIRVIGTFHSSGQRAREITAECPDLELWACDFRNSTTIKKLLDSLRDEKINYIVNNASISLPWNNSNRVFDEDKAERMIAVNLLAPVRLSISLASHLQAGDSIVNIASIDRHSLSHSDMIYVMSKLALINVTKSMAIDLGPRGIRVNAIAPGWINSDGWSQREDSYLTAAHATPLRRNGTPDEIAEVAAFLLSERSSFVHGATITVDGGYSLVAS